MFFLYTQREVAEHPGLTKRKTPCSSRAIEIYHSHEDEGAMGATMVFTESVPRPIQSISCDFRLFVCPLGVTFYWRGLETSCQRGSNLNCLNKNWHNICICFHKKNCVTPSITKPPAAKA